MLALERSELNRASAVRRYRRRTAGLLAKTVQCDGARGSLRPPAARTIRWPWIGAASLRAALALVVLTSAGAWAAAPPDAAQELFDQGVEAARQDRWNDARVVLEDAAPETAPFRSAAAGVLPGLQARIPRIRLHATGVLSTGSATPDRPHRSRWRWPWVWTAVVATAAATVATVVIIRTRNEDFSGNVSPGLIHVP